MSKTGTLYGVGVGPGDPELMTVKAWRLVSTADTIAYLAANGGESTARSIAAPFIDPDTVEIVIDMPMRVEREPAQGAYDAAAVKITERLNAGENVVMLCEGDPFFYGSFMYVFERLSNRFACVVVPGVTSISAASSAIGHPLVSRDEVLKVLPATMDETEMLEELRTANAAAIIKVGRHFAKVKAVLQKAKRNGTAITRATCNDQMIRDVADISENTLPYFTTIIVDKLSP